MINLIGKKLGFIAIILFFLSNDAISSVLLEKAKINAAKFDSKGLPDYVSLNVNKQLIKFDVPRTAPNQEIKMTVSGSYEYVRDKEFKSESIIFLNIDWGDGDTSSHSYSGAPQVFRHAYNSEGIFNIKLLITTSENTYTEYAQVVSTLDPKMIKSSARIQPQKLLWIADCPGVIIDGKCMKEEVVRLELPSKTYPMNQAFWNRRWSSPSSIYIHSFAGIYSERKYVFTALSDCKLQFFKEFSGRIFYDDHSYNIYTMEQINNCKNVKVYGVCPYTYKLETIDHSSLQGVCYKQTTTYVQDSDHAIPASTYSPGDMRYNE